MSMNERTLETLTDLVEIKLSMMEVFDRDDAREVANLERCRDELVTMIRGLKKGEVVSIAGRKRGRRRIHA